MLKRRSFLAGGAALGLSACGLPARDMAPPLSPRIPPQAPVMPPLPAHYGAITDEPFPIPALPENVVPPHLWRQEVDNPFPHDPPGTIIVDPDAGFLHLVGQNGRAMRYGAGTGADAFAWSGDARLQFCRSWPRWRAPDQMIARQPELAPYSVANGGMAPRPGNPLGARALYLFQNGEDTLYRIHGACEPEYLGQAVSSGCVRLLDHDVIDLHERVQHGTTIRVLPSLAPARFAGLY
jgi:lipoprotein-anchoring transpeptidase ErfK/SrfK